MVHLSDFIEEESQSKGEQQALNDIDISLFIRCIDSYGIKHEEKDCEEQVQKILIERNLRLAQNFRSDCTLNSLGIKMVEEGTGCEMLVWSSEKSIVVVILDMIISTP